MYAVQKKVRLRDYNADAPRYVGATEKEAEKGMKH
jgi:hypothetical protein